MSVPPSSAIVFSPAVLAAFKPSPTAMLAALNQQITDDMLVEISNADYAQDAPSHLKELRQIRDTQVIPVPMNWEPHEVLALIRWSEPDDPKWKPGATGRRGHLMRAFACIALLRGADMDSDGCFAGDNSTLIQLVDSALELGGDLPKLLAGYLVWRTMHLAMDLDRPVCLFALLLTLGLGCDQELTDSEFGTLAQLVHSDADAANRMMPRTDDDDMPPRDLCYDRWKSLAARLSARFAGRVPTVVDVAEMCLVALGD